MTTAEAMRLGVNVGTTARGRTLGVAHFAANLVRALQAREDVELTILGEPAAVETYGVPNVFPIVGRLPVSEQTRLRRNLDAVMQIHHFLDRVVKVPTLAIVHDLHLFDVSWKYVSSRARQLPRLEANVRRSDVVISEFPGTIDALARRYPETADRLHLVQSPTLISDFELVEVVRERVRRDYDLDGGPPTVLYPAQLQSHKNHWNLIRALALLRDRGRPVRAICTGSTFEEHLTIGLVERAAQRGLSELVRFPGFVPGDELRALYAEVDAVISPSLAEGGAYIAQEAIVHDRPVACSDLPSVRAHLDRLHVDVPRFDPFDPYGIADAIVATLDDAKQIVSRYDAAKAIEASWSWGEVASDVLRLLADARSGAGEPAPGPSSTKTKGHA